MVHVKYVLVALLAVLVIVASGFAVTPSVDQQVSPVSFEKTLTLGMTGVDVLEAQSAGYSIPRAEVFYSQYQYVIGYYGVDAAAAQIDARETGRQFGRPLSILVTDYTDAAPTLTSEGYLVTNNSIGIDWVSARKASFVVDSRARTPGGPAVVPFGTQSAAESFARRYNGTVVDWDTVRTRYSHQRDGAAHQRDRIVQNRSAWADHQVNRTATLDDRPVSVVVGKDAPTLRAAIQQAAPNSTVKLPAGTYHVNLSVDKPVTISGVGNATHLVGPGTGTVLRLKANRSAVTDLRISGVGPNGSRSLANVSDDWDARIRVAYGSGDAAIRFDNATGSLVRNVAIHTPATGIIIRHGRGTVVRNCSIRGSDKWINGFMGVLPMYDPVVVQNTTIHGGRDGVYTHRANGLVVRHNRMVDMRYGVHEMYTSGSLIEHNTARQTQAGVIVMTRPRGNVLLGNDVRDSDIGLLLSGSASFMADNVVVDNRMGLSIGADRSLVTGNVVVRNGLGIRADTLLPSNTVVGNDIVDNGVQARANRGPVRLWTGDRGNYWGDLPGRDRNGDGTLDAAYHPSGSVDGPLLTADGMLTLRDSPAVGMIRSVQDAVPGLRESGIVDSAPLARPVHPQALDSVNATQP
ncbi:MAG: NosD domain-containing protein [Halorientalis sp.]